MADLGYSGHSARHLLDPKRRPKHASGGARTAGVSLYEAPVMQSEDPARRSFELANAIVPLDSDADSVYAYDADEYQQLLREAPWRKDPHYFQRVRISAVALLKMVLHTRMGGGLEVMGLMQGKVCARTRTMYVMDAFALPVEGTETRVNAQNEAYEYMVDYVEMSRSVDRPENAIGWYHSHPGYGCWLSGIDVQTQRTNQQQDPFVAVVIDPNRTMTAGHVDIGAFRTYPEGYKKDKDAQPRTSVPTVKSEDFGAHVDEYYPLTVDYFKSSLDTRLFETLWHKYWTHALAHSPTQLQHAIAERAEADLVAKLRQVATTQSSAAGPMSAALPGGVRETMRDADTDTAAVLLAQHFERRMREQLLAQTSRDAAKIAEASRFAALWQTLKAEVYGA